MKQENKIPMLDLQAQYEPYKEQVLESIKEVFDSKHFILGPVLESFEQEMADYCQVPFSIGVSSGTDALIVALMGLGIGEGDEVITTPFTFFATVGSIVRVGAKPVFVDIDPDTFNIDPSEIESKITDKTRAIMPVHLFGQMADMDPILALSKKYNLAVIEDAAQAIGAQYQSDDGTLYHAGSMGRMGCFSFFPAKNLGCCGDAGLVSMTSEADYQKIKSLRMHGESQRYYHDFVGGNFRMDPLQAAVLRVKLPYLGSQHEGRRHNAAVYTEAFSSHLKTPHIHSKCKSIFNQYTLKSSERDTIKKALDEAGIASAIYYPVPLHLQECFKYLGHQEGDFPHTEKAAKEVLSLPVYPELSAAQLERVIQTVLKSI